VVLIECCTYCLLSLGAVVMGSSQDDWKKAEAVAKIIARCPSQVTSLMEYYSVVCPQVCMCVYALVWDLSNYLFNSIMFNNIDCCIIQALS